MSAPETPPRMPWQDPHRNCAGELVSCGAILIIAGIVTLTAIVAALYLGRLI